MLGYLLSVERVVPAYSDFESSEKSSVSLHSSLENLEEPIPQIVDVWILKIRGVDFVAIWKRYFPAVSLGCVP